jgi:hypothetical protein
MMALYECEGAENLEFQFDSSIKYKAVLMGSFFFLYFLVLLRCGELFAETFYCSIVLMRCADPLANGRTIEASSQDFDICTKRKMSRRQQHKIIAYYAQTDCVKILYSITVESTYSTSN